MAVLLWAYKTERITIQGATPSNTYNISIAKYNQDILSGGIVTETRTFYINDDPKDIDKILMTNYGFDDRGEVYLNNNLIAKVSECPPTPLSFNVTQDVTSLVNFRGENKLTMIARDCFGGSVGGAVNLTVYRKLAVKPNPILGVSPYYWQTSTKQNSTSPEQNFTVNASFENLPSDNCYSVKWDAKTDNSRLSFSPINGEIIAPNSTCKIAEAKTFKAKFDINGLGIGEYHANLTLTATAPNSVSNSPLIIPVSVVINPATPAGDPIVTCNHQYEGTIKKDPQKQNAFNLLQQELDEPSLSLTSGNANINLVDYLDKNVKVTGCISTITSAKSSLSVTNIEVLTASGQTNNTATVNSSNSSASSGASANTKTSATEKLTSLVSTGQVLWFNILIALALAGIISYFIIKKK